MTNATEINGKVQTALMSWNILATEHELELILEDNHFQLVESGMWIHEDYEQSIRLTSELSGVILELFQKGNPILKSHEIKDSDLAVMIVESFIDVCEKLREVEGGE